MSCLTKAEEIIFGDREQTYGHPGKNLNRVAEYWSVLFNCSVTAEQVCMAMTLLKIAREEHLHKEDNLVDACGYIALIERVKEFGNQQ